MEIPTPNNLSALEKAWQDHAEGTCGWSGAIPPWFANAIAAYVKLTASPMTKADIPALAERLRTVRGQGRHLEELLMEAADALEAAALASPAPKDK